MNQESARALSSATPQLEVSDLPFSRIPHQSRLFLEYQESPENLREFYPNAVESYRDLSNFVPTVLASYETDRDAICDALNEINKAAGSGEKTITNIERLRDASTVAVVTGQQAGLFTGPLYTIFKALSAVRMADDLSASGVSTVPVFWAATEDHDFDEVAKTFAVDNAGELFEVAYACDHDGTMVGDVTLHSGAVNLIDTLFERMPTTEFSDELKATLKQFWPSGERFGQAFLKTLAYLFRDHGLIMIDSTNVGLRKLSSNIFSKAIEPADEIEDLLLKQSQKLVTEKYHAQVLIEPGYFPMFWIDDEKKRVALKKVGEDRYRVKDSKIEFNQKQLLDIAATTPERLSPGVMFRPVVQDVLLPTVCYLGGAAEIAYFAQNSEVYRVLERPVTPILHRQSYTLLEPKQRRFLSEFHLQFADLFDGIEKVTLKVSEGHLAGDSVQLFDEVEENLEAALHRLDQHLSAIDPTVAANLATRRRKIIYHIAALKKKTLLARARKEGDIDRQLSGLFAPLMPNGALQERSLNIFVFLNKFGPGLIDWLYQATDVDRRDHRVIDL